MSNPFAFGRAVSGEDLADRETEVANAVSALTQGGKLFLIGPRRFGKTSILLTARQMVQRQGGVVLHYDLQAFVTADAFLKALVSEAVGALTGTVQQFGQKLTDFFRSLRPTVSYDPVDGSWTASLGVEGGERPAPLLAEGFDGLESMARDAKRRVGVILDEFQAIFSLGGTEIEGALRSAVQRHAQVGYVFSGSQTRLLTDMTGDAGRPFYRLGARRYLGPIQRELFTVYLEQRFQQSGFETDAAAVQSILDLAQDVPYNVQALAHAAWELLRGSGASRLTVEGVVAAGELLARRDDPFYTAVWESLSSSQKAMLVAVVRQRGRKLLGAEARRVHRLPTPGAQKALGALEKKGLVRREPAQGETVWRLEDPFVAVWLDHVLGARP